MDLLFRLAARFLLLSFASSMVALSWLLQVGKRLQQLRLSRQKKQARKKGVRCAACAVGYPTFRRPSSLSPCVVACPLHRNRYHFLSAEVQRSLFR